LKSHLFIKIYHLYAGIAGGEKRRNTGNKKVMVMAVKKRNGAEEGVKTELIS
jgi:hypothetical protein